MSITVEDIRAAAERLKPVIRNTPFEQSHTLSDMLGPDIFIKFENHQFTAAFKERGALNKLLQLEDQPNLKGVIAMSAGNHAKAVAYHAARLGVAATIVMPRFTPNVKVQDTENFGATVVLHGDNLIEATEHAQSLAEEQGLTFIHPFDDDDVIAGQGTIGLEMLEKNPDLDLLLVPIGGGGLIAGVATAAKALKPSIEVIGVQSSSYSPVFDHFHPGHESEGGSTLAEGIAVKQPGTKTLAIIDELVDDVVLVSEEDIERAVSLYIKIEKTVAEGAGAAALGAIISQPERFVGKKVGVILSGANIDSKILANILMRDLVNTGRMVCIRVILDDAPGALSKVTSMIGESGGNIVDVAHQRIFSQVRVKETNLDMTIETKDYGRSECILEKLQGAGYRASFMQPSPSKNSPNKSSWRHCWLIN